MNSYMEAVNKLYGYIQQNHWSGESLIGPDPGLRWDFRLYRFIKSGLRFLPWKDQYYFLQCQGYWILDNWWMYEMKGKADYHDIALSCTKSILKLQHPEGYWEYPLPQWKGKIATVDCIYAALGLLETYKRINHEIYLEGAVKYHRFLTTKTGFQKYKDGLSINYFAGQEGNLVPNNSTLTLTFLSELYKITLDNKFLIFFNEMTKFITLTQKQSGELPYLLKPDGSQGREHFLCYQYNSFQFLDLVKVWEITQNKEVYRIMQNLIKFLKTGQHKDGHSKYKCNKEYPEVPYYSAVMAAAFLKATEIGLGDYIELSNITYTCLLKHQNAKGGFPYSMRNYGLLSDHRSYPRYLVMILKHLLMKLKHETQ